MRSGLLCSTNRVESSRVECERKKERKCREASRSITMAEEREDPQKLKKIAAAAYDYENDPRWADYWSNILIPPHMASSSDVIAHFKQKFYKRFIVSNTPKPILSLFSCNFYLLLLIHYRSIVFCEFRF